MMRSASVSLVLALALLRAAGGADPVKTEADLKREAAIAEFTAKMKSADYPALFDAAAKEFNVPADILKGVAFAETRWEQLTWPSGETASPETGMPRPYGIMSLWDNSHFGHSLIEAAALIGKTTDELQQDPLQNIRGGAALLRRIYDANPKPEGTTEADIESWRSKAAPPRMFWKASCFNSPGVLPMRAAASVRLWPKYLLSQSDMMP